MKFLPLTCQQRQHDEAFASKQAMILQFCLNKQNMTTYIQLPIWAKLYPDGIMDQSRSSRIVNSLMESDQPNDTHKLTPTCDMFSPRYLSPRHSEVLSTQDNSWWNDCQLLRIPLPHFVGLAKEESLAHIKSPSYIRAVIVLLLPYWMQYLIRCIVMTLTWVWSETALISRKLYRDE